MWYIYRNKGALKISALIRTIVTEGTIYFFAIVAVQTYTQISLTLLKVYSLPRSPLHLVVINHKFPRASLNNSQFCECAINSNDNRSHLTVSTSCNEVHTGCTFTPRRSLVASS